MTSSTPSPSGRPHRDHIGWQARCGECGETFIPDGPADVTHLTREDGNDCGGQASDIYELRRA